VIQALIFDFDGLIIDTEWPDFTSWQETYQAYGCTLSRDEWSRWIGTLGLYDPYARLEEQLGRPLDRSEVRAARRARFDALMQGQPVLPGVRATIDAARQRGLKLGIASSSPRSWVWGLLEPLGLAPAFDTVQCSDDVGATKPDPASYLAALAALGVDARQALALEDSPNGVRAAKAAGLYCVAVPNSMTVGLAFEGADLQVGSLAELSLEELLSIGGGFKRNTEEGRDAAP
jgi:HAD superfamily hydrolase (TIGR01509 family)